MKRMLLTTLLVSALSTWSVARVQTAVETHRPGTSAEVNRPQTVTGAVRPFSAAQTQRPGTQAGAVPAPTTVSVTRPQTAAGAVYPATPGEVIHPATTVETVRPQTIVEFSRPQTPEFTSASEAAPAGAKKGKSAAVPSAPGATSRSNFTPKQAKDFLSAQKAAPLGGGENKLGNDTNAAEKDAANKASLLGKQSHQTMDVNPNLKQGNLAAIGSAVDKKVEEKKKK